MRVSKADRLLGGDALLLAAADAFVADGFLGLPGWKIAEALMERSRVFEQRSQRSAIFFYASPASQFRNLVPLIELIYFLSCFVLLSKFVGAFHYFYYLWSMFLKSFVPSNEIIKKHHSYNCQESSIRKFHVNWIQLVTDKNMSCQPDKYEVDNLY